MVMGMTTQDLGMFIHIIGTLYQVLYMTTRQTIHSTVKILSHWDIG